LPVRGGLPGIPNELPDSSNGGGEKEKSSALISISFIPSEIRPFILIPLGRSDPLAPKGDIGEVVKDEDEVED